MKLVFAGKGGSGKASISSTMTRQPARAGYWVLAINADADPNFTLTLGIPAERTSDIPALPSDLLRRTAEASVPSRLAVLAQDLGLARAALIANKVPEERDLTAVTTFAGKQGLEMGGSVPFDDLFAEAEWAEVAPLDIPPDAPAIHAIATVARQWGTNERA